MATLKKYDVLGKEIGTEEVNIDGIDKLANSQMIKDYLVALRANKRQWNASTKGRKEVNRTGRKPFQQKGTGKARQGCLAAPQFRGGGIVFGPKPKFDMFVKVNRKEKISVIKTLLCNKIKNSDAIVLKLEGSDIKKTKQVNNFLKNLKFDNKRVLFVADLKINENLKRCSKNIQKTEFADLKNINGYNVALCSKLIFVDGSIDQLNSLLTKGT
ncbi:MAG: 50S ribosomal protein L4 [Chlamydiae bacterium RIFCSPHIGHO2_12_FULL_27_8]|nr:MAG: 50S ribosomal protein L4 [Chlamydiae bacterium RIFCSPHIGHO2_12_FULL_27_8]OGN64915.1 MAG: 50S ribosomal protein L4 [Chlamydiae bacterium RIFCSPLOWO2_01_FULL_28_7]